MFKKIQFFISLTIVILIILMMFVPSLFTNINPYATEGLRSYVDDAGTFHLEKAPFKPQSDIWMGTDELGRSIWALIIYGTKLTISLAGLIVIFRFLIAVPIGMLAGFGSLSAHSIIDKMNRFLGTIPTLLLSILILRMDFFTNLSKTQSVISFVIVLSIIGFAKLAVVIEERVKAINSEPFVTGDIALGKKPLQIALTTILRHLYPELIAMFFMEIARALTLLLQLGLFAVFVGNVKFIEDSSNGNIKTMNVSYEPEWASMLGAARIHLRSAPWIVFFPSLAFFISVLGFNAFGESVRKLLKGEMSILRIKPILISLSVLLIVFISGYQLVDWVGVHTGYASKILSTERLMLEPGPILLGNSNALKAADWISSELDTRGFTPLKGNSYIDSYTIDSGYYATNDEVELNQVSFKGNYEWVGYGNYDLTSELVDLKDLDVLNLGAEALSMYSDKIILLNGNFYSHEAIVKMTERILSRSNVDGIIWMKPLDEVEIKWVSKQTFAVPVLYVSNEFELKSGDQLHVKLDMGTLGSSGNNIYGILKGTNTNLGEEALIYGFGYNAMDEKRFSEQMSFNLSLIDALIKDDANRKRTIIVLFFDGGSNYQFDGRVSYAEQSLYPQKDILLYFDLTHIEAGERGTIFFNQDQSPISRYYAYSFAVQLEAAFNGISDSVIRNQKNWKNDDLLYLSKGIPTLTVGFTQNEKGETLSNLGSILSRVIRKNNY
ncbi:MAG: hypothetical protein BGO41_12455 [Clostridiales bacterium 38-18]|nr:MAG: hypothetical protein BGO41_12455 [Clostridiales bacterium 38-18]